MDFIVLLLTLQTGVYTDDALSLGGSSYREDQTYFIQAEIEVRAWDSLFFRAKEETKAIDPTTNGFAPIHAEYLAAIGVRLGKLEVGFEHVCLHPIQTANADFRQSPLQLYGGHNKLYVQYEFEFKP